MSSTVAFSRYDSIAVLTLDNPPVNSLGASTRYALRQAFRMALADPKIRAIVITAKGRLFSAGADIGEFQAKPADSSLRDLFMEIERSSKPITVSINGMALGGALELALVCHYRVTTSKAQLGLPEVNIGVIPGAGGTQRLPRLIGMNAAIEIITSGKPISAKKALEVGLIDAILSDGPDFEKDAIQFARDALDKGGATNSRNIAFADLPEDPDFAANWTEKVARTSRGRTAPLRALESVINATTLPLDEGLAREADIFNECNASAEGRGMQHIFFAERKAAQIRDLPDDIQSRPLDQVAIIGAGTMGGGIAMNFLNAGIPVTLLDMSDAGLEKGLAAIRNHYEISVARGRFTPEQVEQRLKLLHGRTDYEAVGTADIVIEAVFENLDVKKQVFSELDRAAKPGAILATNTSTLDVNLIAAATTRPQDVIGLHFFSPANVMRLVEIVRARDSAPDTVKTAMEMSKRIGKVGVVVGVCYGFVGNRMLEPYGREAHRLLLEGASPEAIDKALTDFGMSMGPLSMYDMAGNDIGALMRKANKAAIAHDPSYYRMGDVLAGQEDYGQKTGRGFYTYQGREKGANLDLAELVEKQAAALGITRRSISDQEILERCMFPLIDEGIRILEEGIAQRPGDIDVIWCNGYGFPGYRGGPTHWADEIGAATIYRALIDHQNSLGDYGKMWFQPSTSLQKLAHSGSRIADLFSDN